MLKIYAAGAQHIETVDPAAGPTPHPLIWCDLLNPSAAEEAWTERLLGVDVPTRDEMHEIELSNRLYRENGALYATVTIVTGGDTPTPETHAVTFVLKDDCLVSVRYVASPVFDAAAALLLSQSSTLCRGRDVLLGVIEAFVNRAADLLEAAARTLNDINRQVFRPQLNTPGERTKTVPDFEALLRDIGIQGDVLAKIHESLLSLTRALGFAAGSSAFPPGSEIYERTQVLHHDIAALSDHDRFLTEKTCFLLDATLGMLNIQQNVILKIFSVASVVFLPPMWVAGVYGMNFKNIPELNMPYGYPASLLLMAVSAWLPYRVCKMKKWL